MAAEVEAAPRLAPGPGLLELCSAIPAAINEECERHQELMGMTVACAFECAVQLLRATVEQAIVETAAARNNSRKPGAVARLAPELLCAVFAHLALADRIAASHVSRSWRSTALASTALWADIASHNQPAGVLTQRITRVPSEALVNLSVYVNTDTVQEVACVLASHMGRLRQLWMRVSDKLDEDARRALREALAHPAPHLWQLRILDGKRNILPDSSTPIFAGTAPNLKLVKFYGHSRLLDALPSSSVDRILFSESGATDVETLRSSLDHFSKASGFAIEIDEWSDSSSSSSSSPEVLDVPPAVSTLLLVSNDDDVDMRLVVRHLLHAPLRVFGIAFRSRAAMAEEDTAQLFHSVLRDAPTGLRDSSTPGPTQIEWVQVLQSFHKTGRVQVDVRLRDGRHRAILKCQYAWASHLTSPSSPFNGVRHLRLGETLLFTFSSSSPGPYVLPAVEQLDIILVAPDRQAERGADSVFFLPRRPGSWLSLPALKALAFYACDTALALPVAAEKAGVHGRGGGAGRGTVLAPEMLREFLTWHLDVDSHSSSGADEGFTLALRGVGLLDSNVPELALLLALPQLRDVICEEDDGVGRGVDDGEGRGLGFSVVREFGYLTSWDYDERFPNHD